MGRQWGKLLVLLAVVALVAAACGDDNGDDGASDDDTTTTTEAEETTTTTEASGERAAGEFGCSDSIPDCEGTITPSEGLTDGATVSIQASGFSPDLTLGITQCVDTNDPDNNLEETTSDDCYLRGIGNTAADAEGNVTAEYTVAAGQTMIDNTGNGVTCDATHDCVVSVGQLTPDPDAERVTFTVKFA
jgi:hypothetical protein